MDTAIESKSDYPELINYHYQHFDWLIAVAQYLHSKKSEQEDQKNFENNIVSPQTPISAYLAKNAPMFWDNLGLLSEEQQQEIRENTGRYTHNDLFNLVKLPWKIIKLILDLPERQFPAKKELKEIQNSKKIKRGEILTKENSPHYWELVRFWLPTIDNERQKVLEDQIIALAKKKRSSSIDEQGNIKIYTDDLIKVLSKNRYPIKDLVARSTSTKTQAKQEPPAEPKAEQEPPAEAQSIDKLIEDEINKLKNEGKLYTKEQVEQQLETINNLSTELNEVKNQHKTQIDNLNNQHEELNQKIQKLEKILTSPQAENTTPEQTPEPNWQKIIESLQSQVESLNVNLEQITKENKRLKERLDKASVSSPILSVTNNNGVAEKALFAQVKQQPISSVIAQNYNGNSKNTRINNAQVVGNHTQHKTRKKH